MLAISARGSGSSARASSEGGTVRPFEDRLVVIGLGWPGARP
jgi:hypothetical protein